MSGSRTIHIAIILILAGAFVVAVSMMKRCWSLNKTLAETVTQYKCRIADLEHQLELCEAERSDMVRLLPGLDDVEESIFRKRGLSDPTGDIIRDTEKREELMAFTGVFGARPSFYVKARSYLINGKWAYYSIVDGSRIGESLLSYTVDDSGAISWRVVDTSIRTISDRDDDTGL